ncbi:DNA-binding XRE family transcriptional regulator [Rhizobium sp. BK312]|uniref:helix-turn-helix domain-containing protein n=1 Tax=Rhizobium sp. BK312 TaxID=2587080 RepID=UPI000DC2F79D|nr:helix-turn-helix transcriptional regulator [Rhizobium sp. BK312]MBB3429082.1 DNA-binding XRE family transcriptional regulator [Rhizobium sp. BK312]
MINSKSHESNKITGTQLRAARAMIRWSAKDLAKAAGIGVATVSRAEVEDGTPSITNANLRAMQLALETAGIEFIPENGGGAGVRLKKPE